ncbi:MAG: ABA4-like family protein, partial [Cyanobacteria bacterium J06623_4]
MVIEYFYNGANLFALPFWALMVVVPGWSVTRRVMGSTLMFVPLALAYLYCFANSLDPDSMAAFANPTLSTLAGLFADERVMATGWIHYIVMDLFVGRWIYWQGQEKGIW